MTFLQAIILGLVQGIGEFLPISSSAHLIFIPQIFHWKDPGLTFDVALHIGTLIAVIIYFWKDWIKLIYCGFKDVKSTEGKLFWYIFFASIPGAIFGKLFESEAETVFRNLALIGTTLIVMGIILYFAEKVGRKSVKINQLGFRDSFIIGVSQALAIIPGISRSGVTMTTGLFLGLTKESAARFSFLLSTPIVFGAGIFKIKDMMHVPIGNVSIFIIGIITAMISGLLSIKFLLNYLRDKGFGIFAVYRIVVGILLIGIYFISLK